VRRRNEGQGGINPAAVNCQSESYAGKRYAELQDFGDYMVLKELLIEEKRLVESFDNKYQSKYRSLGSFAKKGSDLNPGTSFVDLLRQVVPINYVDGYRGNIYLRAQTGTNAIRDTSYAQRQLNDLGFNNSGALFVVNDVPWGRDYRVLNFLSPDMIDEITVIRGAGAGFQYGGRAGDGIVFVTTRNDVSPPEQEVPRNFAIAPMYSGHKVFYAPLYATDSLRTLPLPDLRSTVHWAPEVITDSQGKAKLQFYNADRATTIKAYINGITDFGQLAHGSTRYKVL